MRIIRPYSYQRKEKKFFKRHPELINQYVKALKLMSLNLNHPSLRLHEIKQKNCHSISINMQYRVLITLKFIGNNEIILIDVGAHDVYR